jgi:hypothetical protein
MTYLSDRHVWAGRPTPPPSSLHHLFPDGMRDWVQVHLPVNNLERQHTRSVDCTASIN